MSKTKEQLKQEILSLRETWWAPTQYEKVLAERDILRERLQTAKAALDDLVRENQLLHGTIEHCRGAARQDQETLTGLEAALEQMIPPQFLGERWDDLVEPLTKYIADLQAKRPITPETITLPIVLEIKVRGG